MRLVTYTTGGPARGGVRRDGAIRDLGYENSELANPAEAGW